MLRHAVLRRADSSAKQYEEKCLHVHHCRNRCLLGRTQVLLLVAERNCELIGKFETAISVPAHIVAINLRSGLLAYYHAADLSSLAALNHISWQPFFYIDPCPPFGNRSCGIARAVPYCF